MPSKNSLISVLFLKTKIYIFLLVLFHSGVADLPKSYQKRNQCSNGKIPNFLDRDVCVIPVGGICEDNLTSNGDNFQCGPGAECLNTSCKCIEGHIASEDRSGCILSHKTHLSLISKETVSPAAAPTSQNSTKNDDQSRKKPTTKEYYVMEPTTTLDGSIKLKSTVPTTVVFNDAVIFQHFTRSLISRTGSSSGGYHKTGYHQPRNGTAVSAQMVNVKSAVVCSIISSFAFYQFHF